MVEDSGSNWLINIYFNMKQKTHKRNYQMTAKDYITRYYITHIYTLEVNYKVLSLILSCEQGNIVYIEN